MGGGGTGGRERPGMMRRERKREGRGGVGGVAGERRGGEAGNIKKGRGQPAWWLGGNRQDQPSKGSRSKKVRQAMGAGAGSSL